MIDLDKHYGEMNAQELVEIIESLKEYKPEVIEYCKNRIKKMRIKKDTLKSYSRNVIKKRFYKYFSNGDYLSNSPIIIDSFYLNKDDVKSCFDESKYKYTKYIEGATTNLPSG
jgi:hypothetical protein